MVAIYRILLSGEPFIIIIATRLLFLVDANKYCGVAVNFMRRICFIFFLVWLFRFFVFMFVFIFIWFIIFHLYRSTFYHTSHWHFLCGKSNWCMSLPVLPRCLIRMTRFFRLFLACLSRLRHYVDTPYRCIVKCLVWLWLVTV